MNTTKCLKNTNFDETEQVYEETDVKSKGTYTWYSASLWIITKEDIIRELSWSPQKRSGMARVLKGSHSFTCIPTRSIRNRNEPYLPLPSQL